jgi:hypothetical protein
MVALDWPVNMTDAKYPQPHLKKMEHTFSRVPIKCETK